MTGMKAYKLSCCDDDHWEEVVFADNANEARMRRNQDLCDCGYINTTACRYPAFDKYLGIKLTPDIYLAAGWYWQCQGCQKTLYNDENPIVRGNEVFCSGRCLIAFDDYWGGVRCAKKGETELT